MSTIVIILYILMFYLYSIGLTCMIHVLNNTREFNGFWDICKLTFLPYVLFNLKKIRED